MARRTKVRLGSRNIEFGVKQRRNLLGHSERKRIGGELYEITGYLGKDAAPLLSLEGNPCSVGHGRPTSKDAKRVMPRSGRCPGDVVV